MVTERGEMMLHRHLMYLHEGEVRTMQDWKNIFRKKYYNFKRVGELGAFQAAFERWFQRNGLQAVTVYREAA